MTCSPRRRLRLLAGIAVLAAGCGGGGSRVDVGAPEEVTAPAGVTTTLVGDPGAAATPAAPTGPASGATPAPVTSGSILPSVRLTDVRSGSTVDLAALVPADKPLLLWFWAPH